MFDLVYNGAILGKSIVIPTSNSESRTIQVVHNQGASAAGKLVSIETSAPTYIDTLSGNLDANGQFQFVLGPSFGTRGNLNLVVKVSNAHKSLDVVFA